MVQLFIPIQGSPVEKPAPLKAINLNIAHLIVGAKKPDFDAEVLMPLRKAQAEAARVAAVEAARVVEVRRVQQLTASRPATAVAPPTQVSGTHNDWMIAAGIDAANFGYVEYIIDHESGWRWWATNNEGSGATGLGQALPGSKMLPFGADYLTNPVTQLKWAQSYAVARYGNWANAYAFWLSHRYW